MPQRIAPVQVQIALARLTSNPKAAAEPKVRISALRPKALQCDAGSGVTRDSRKRPRLPHGSRSLRSNHIESMDHIESMERHSQGIACCAQSEHKFLACALNSQVRMPSSHMRWWATGSSVAARLHRSTHLELWIRGFHLRTCIVVGCFIWDAAAAQAPSQRRLLF